MAINLAVRNLWRRRSRTAAVLLAIVLSSALLFSTISIGNGIVSSVRERVEMTNIDMVLGGDVPQSIPGAHAIADDINSMEGVISSSPMLFSQRTVRMDSVDNPEGPLSPFPVGFIPGPARDIFSDSWFESAEGWFSNPGDPHYANGTYEGPWMYEVGLVMNLANRLRVGIGDTVSVYVEDSWVDFRVSFMMDPEFGGQAGEGIYFAFFYLSELQSILGLDMADGKILDVVDTITVVVTSDYRSDTALFNSLVQELQQKYPFYTLETRDDVVRELESQMAMTEAFSLAIGGIGLVIGLLFVTTSMLVSVDERKWETAMLRAMGFSGLSISKTFFFEAFLLLLLGTLGGFGVGLVFRSFLAQYMMSQYGITMALDLFEPTVLLRYSVFAFLLGSLASLYPALKASRGPIAQSIKEVGL